MARFVTRSSISAGGGGGDQFSTRVPGTPYAYYDWNVTAGRLTSGATKQAAFVGHGVMTGGATGVIELKDNTTSGTAGGYIWTGSASDGNTAYGHNIGALPWGVSKVLFQEGDPRGLGSYDGLNEYQSDFYLTFGTWKPCIAVRFWQYIFPVCTALPIGSTFAPNNKEFYPANEQAGGPPYGHYFFLDGWRVENHDNGLRTGGDRTTFTNGTRARNVNTTSFTSKGMGGSSATSRLDYTGGVDNINNPSRECGMGAGAAGNTSAVLEKFMQAGTWYEKTYFVDHSGAQGKVSHWIRAKGESTATLMWEFEGGVTSGYSWPVPTAESANGNTVNLRTANQICKWPTVTSAFNTVDGIDVSAEGKFIKAIGPMEFADSVAQLSTSG